jgi:hypothetical protein
VLAARRLVHRFESRSGCASWLLKNLHRDRAKTGIPVEYLQTAASPAPNIEHGHLTGTNNRTGVNLAGTKYRTVVEVVVVVVYI